MEDLKEAAKLNKEDYIQDLLEDFFKNLLYREGTIQDYKDCLPTDFYNFINEVQARGKVIQRITKDNVKKFFAKANKLELSANKIRKRLLAKYCNLFQVFLLAEANVLLPH